MVACQIKFKSNQSLIPSVATMLRRGSIVTRSAGHCSRPVSGRVGSPDLWCVCVCVWAATSAHSIGGRINEVWMFIKRREIYSKTCYDQVLDVPL